MHTEEKLHSYALWYISKYAPSRSRLRDKLSSRCEDESIVDRILDQVSMYIDDERLLRGLIGSWIESGIGTPQIRSRLIRRQYRTQMIDTILREVLGDQRDTMRRDDRIDQLISQLRDKRHSQRAMEQKLLARYPEAADYIRERLQTIDDRETLQSMEEMGEDIRDTKMIARLMSRGFAYRDITRR